MPASAETKPKLILACDREGAVVGLDEEAKDLLARIGLHDAEAILPRNHRAIARACIGGGIPALEEAVCRGRLFVWFYQPSREGGLLIYGLEVSGSVTPEEERSFLASIVESSDDAVIGNLLDGTIVSWNRGAEEIYGYGAGEVKGRPISILALPERADEVAQMLERIRRGERIRRFETMHIRKDGRVIYVSLTLSPIFDAAGVVCGASTIAREVTGRIRAQEELREAEEKYRQLFSAENDAIILFDADTGKIADFNEAALKLYGYDRESFSALALGDLGEVPAGEGRRGPTYHRRADGTSFPAEISSSTFTWSGRRMLVGIVRDISERQKMERVRQSLAMAAGIQRHLLPAEAPQVEGFDIAAGSSYCEEIGGDYYDFIDLGEGRLALAVGDVAGHGIGAAVLMAMAKGVLRVNAERYDDDLAALFRSVNRQLVRNTADEGFMTLFYAILDGPSATLRWNSAAQGPVFLFRRGREEIEELPTTGLPLGIFEDAPFEPSGPIALEGGDILLIGTDGIWEARNPVGEMFGTGRLRQILATLSGKPARSIHAAVMSKVREFSAGVQQEDDITLMVLAVR